MTTAALVKKSISCGSLQFQGVVHYHHGEKHDRGQADMLLEELKILNLDPQVAEGDCHIRPSLSI